MALHHDRLQSLENDKRWTSRTYPALSAAVKSKIDGDACEALVQFPDLLEEMPPCLFEALKRDEPWLYYPSMDELNMPVKTGCISTLPGGDDDHQLGPFKLLLIALMKKLAIKDKRRSLVQSDVVEALGYGNLRRRLVLEAHKQIPKPSSHIVFESFKARERRNSEEERSRDKYLVDAQTFMFETGRLGICYQPGMKLRLSEKKWHIVLPRVFRLLSQRAEECVPLLAQCRLGASAHNWSNAQLTMGLHVLDQVEPGLWQWAVDLHFEVAKLKVKKKKRLVKMSAADASSCIPHWLPTSAQGSEEGYSAFALHDDTQQVRAEAPAPSRPMSAADLALLSNGVRYFSHLVEQQQKQRAHVVAAPAVRRVQKLKDFKIIRPPRATPPRKKKDE